MKCLVLLMFLSVLSCVSCSVPTLESESCLQAQGSLKKLLSLHFDKGFEGGKEYKEHRSQYITDRLKDEIDARPGFDYLTQTIDPPKAFRIGTCTERGKDVVSLSVLLFWRDEKRSEQREVNIVLKRVGDKWLTDSASPGK
jgi:hypothetical protein